MVVTLIVISFAFFSYGFELQLGGAQGAGSAKTGTEAAKLFSTAFFYQLFCH